MVHSKTGTRKRSGYFGISILVWLLAFGLGADVDVIERDVVVFGIGGQIRFEGRLRRRLFARDSARVRALCAGVRANRLLARNEHAKRTGAVFGRAFSGLELHTNTLAHNHK